MSNQHVLKIHPAPLADLLSGAKTAEVRRNDRGFQVGDTVRLMEVNPETGNWTGAADQFCTITHIQTGYGLPDDMCVLSYGKVGHDYKAHWMGFMDRTDWMQEKGQVPAKYLGQHRADILTDMLREAREALARVEAERDAERARGDAAVGDANEAEAQLAELQSAYVTMTNQTMLVDGEYCYYLKSSEMAALDRIFKDAQAEQPKAQDAQAVDEPKIPPMGKLDIPVRGIPLNECHSCGWLGGENEVPGEEDQCYCPNCRSDNIDDDVNLPRLFHLVRYLARAALATQPALPTTRKPIATDRVLELWEDSQRCCNDGNTLKFARAIEAESYCSVRGAEHE